MICLIGTSTNNVPGWIRKECVIDYDFINGGSNVFSFNIFDKRNNDNWKLNEKCMHQKADIDLNITYAIHIGKSSSICKT